MRRSILATAGAVAVGLTACSNGATPTSAHVGQGGTVSVSCRQQYNAWSHGQGKGIIAALNAVSAAEVGGDNGVLTTALESNKSAISSAARYPVPACADPGRYWNVLMMHVTAAANTTSASSVQAAMKGVPEIAQHLTAELKAL